MNNPPPIKRLNPPSIRKNPLKQNNVTMPRKSQMKKNPRGNITNPNFYDNQQQENTKTETDNNDTEEMNVNDTGNSENQSNQGEMVKKMPPIKRPPPLKKSFTTTELSNNENQMSEMINKLKQYGDKFVVCQYNWKAQKENQLSFIIGSILAISDNANRNWWLAYDVEGNKGFIPSNYVRVLQNPNELNAPNEMPQRSTQVLETNSKPSPPKLSRTTQVTETSSPITKPPTLSRNTQMDTRYKEDMEEDDENLKSEEIENCLKEINLSDYTINFTTKGFKTLHALRLLRCEDFDSLGIDPQHTSIIYEKIQSTGDNNNKKLPFKKNLPNPKARKTPPPFKKMPLPSPTPTNHIAKSNNENEIDENENHDRFSQSNENAQSSPSTQNNNPPSENQISSPSLQEKASPVLPVLPQPPSKLLPKAKKQIKGVKKLPPVPRPKSKDPSTPIKNFPIKKMPPKGTPGTPQKNNAPPIDISSLPSSLDIKEGDIPDEEQQEDENTTLEYEETPSVDPNPENKLPHPILDRRSSSSLLNFNYNHPSTPTTEKKELDLKRYSIEKVEMKMEGVRDKIVYESKKFIFIFIFIFLF